MSRKLPVVNTMESCDSKNLLWLMSVSMITGKYTLVIQSMPALSVCYNMVSTRGSNTPSPWVSVSTRV